MAVSFWSQLLKYAHYQHFSGITLNSYTCHFYDFPNLANKSKVMVCEKNLHTTSLVVYILWLSVKYSFKDTTADIFYYFPGSFFFIFTKCLIHWDCYLYILSWYSISCQLFTVFNLGCLTSINCKQFVSPVFFVLFVSFVWTRRLNLCVAFVNKIALFPQWMTTPSWP